MASRHISRVVLGLLLAAALAGGILAWRESRPKVARDRGDSSTVPELRFCTNPGATTPQLPIWSAVRADAAGKTVRLKIETWRQPVQLQTALLAGEGDLWLGHIDGIARARAAGAPVVLLAVTGWRKMSVVSYDAKVSTPRDLLGRALPYAPKGSPAVALLRSLLGADADRVLFEPRAPKQLALLLTQRQVDSALLPEPLVSTLLGKLPDLRLAFDLEDAYGAHRQGPARIPWAGLAAHERVLREHPERLAALIAAMKEAATRLCADLDAAPTCLPKEFAAAVPRAALRASLDRDLILVKSADEVRDEIRAYLELAIPDAFTGQASWFDHGFLWRRESRAQALE